MYMLLQSLLLQFSQSSEVQFHCRTASEYDFHASLLLESFSNKDSTTYGLNFSSPLNDVKFFHVSKGQLPQDIMHTLLEGVLLMEIRLMIEAFIYVEGLFTLEELNDRIASFSYGRLETKNKPPKRFEVNHVKGVSKLPLSG